MRSTSWLMATLRAFEPANFGPGTAGFRGECSLCWRERRRGHAVKSIENLAGRRYALCHEHALPFENAAATTRQGGT